MGEPFFYYTMKKGMQPKEEYSVEDIQSAILTLTSGDSDKLSESTFEAILDLVYYPEHLGILVNTRLTPALIDIFLRFPEGRSGLNYSFGFLLFQCIALVTSVGLLAQNDKLDSFIASIDPPAEQARIDVSPLMTTWLMDMINEDISSSSNLLFDLSARFGWTLDGENMICLTAIGGHSLVSTLYLITHCFHGRDGALKAYTSMSALGWPVLLIVMWAHLKATDLDNKLVFLTKLREVVLRYALVSAPSEHLVMQALVEDLVNTVPPQEKHPPPLNTFSVMGMDAINISTALTEQLSFRQVDSTSMKLKYLTRLTDYALQILGHSGQPNSLSVLKAAFDRIWHEFTRVSESPDRDFLEHVILFATLLLHDIAKRITKDGNFHIFGHSLSTIPQIISALVQVDMINFVGRLLLLPLTGSSPQIGSSSTVIIDETLRASSKLTQCFSQYREMSRPPLGERYLDWLKTWNYMHQLPYMAIRQDLPLYPHILECAIAWSQFGQALGYSDQIRHPQCRYPRCAGGMEVPSGSMACDRCLQVIYCSPRCQQAAWNFDSAPHREICKGYQ